MIGGGILFQRNFTYKWRGKCGKKTLQYLQAHPPLKVKSHMSTRINKLSLVVGTCETAVHKDIFGKKLISKKDNGKICAAEKRGWKFFGYGIYGKHDAYTYQEGTTFTQCLGFCEDKRRRDGKAWNGMYWHRSDSTCFCNKNDKGHSGSSNWLHFKVNG